MTDTSPHSDPLLRVLLSLAQAEPRFSASITLTTGGGIVTGQLVNRDAWAEQLGELMAGAGEGAEALADGIQGGFRESDLNAPVDQEVTYEHIHLSNAHIYTGADVLPARNGGPGLLWRGRASMVSGWSFGELG